MNGSILFPQVRRRHKNEIFLRMSVCTASAPDWHPQTGCVLSIARPFAVRIPPHHAAVAHGWVTHPRLTGDARVTTFALCSVMTRRSWLPRRSCPAVPRGARWAWWDKQTRDGTQSSTNLLASQVFLQSLTHLDALVAPVHQWSIDQGSPSHPSHQALLQKRSLCLSVGAIKLYESLV